MQNLFEKNRLLNTDTFRNIVYLKDHPGYRSKNIKTSLEESVLEQAELFGRKKFNTMNNKSDFYYTTSIGYPFRNEHYANTRYSNGSFAVWYGSLKEETTFYETAYNSFKFETDIEGNNEIIKRERASFNVHCKGLFVDLYGLETKYPELVANDYHFCQKVGSFAHEADVSGLITPSARCVGENVNVLKESILSDPKLHQILYYNINLKDRSVAITKENDDVIVKINY